jgi:hypothetical protein
MWHRLISQWHCCPRPPLATPTEGSHTRLLMNITVTPDDRYEGEIRSDHDTIPFTGKLELLAAMEELLSEPGVVGRTENPSPERR